MGLLATYSFISFSDQVLHILRAHTFVPKIVTNELHSYTKMYELFITRGITRLFHHLISFALAFIFQSNLHIL